MQTQIKISCAGPKLFKLMYEDGGREELRKLTGDLEVRHVCMHACMYFELMYVCMYVWRRGKGRIEKSDWRLGGETCMHAYVYVCIHVCMYVFFTYVCMYVCMYVDGGREELRKLTGDLEVRHVCMHTCMYVL
jgi:hypothetical protein